MVSDPTYKKLAHIVGELIANNPAAAREGQKLLASYEANPQLPTLAKRFSIFVTNASNTGSMDEYTEEIRQSIGELGIALSEKAIETRGRKYGSTIEPTGERLPTFGITISPTDREYAQSRPGGASKFIRHLIAEHRRQNTPE